MLDGIFNQTNYVAAKKMLDMTALRHEAIASNLANLETPGYRRIDVAPSFSAELGRALGSKDPSAIAQLRPSLEIDPLAIPNTRDGNSVQLEHELMQLNQNTLAHTVESQLITGALLRLKLAVTGRST